VYFNFIKIGKNPLFIKKKTYSPFAYRGFARDFIKDLERIKPSTIIDIIKSGESFLFEKEKEKKQILLNCEKCGYISSQKLCRACVFLIELNKGKPKLSVKFDEKISSQKNEKKIENIEINDKIIDKDLEF
jgi:cytoplasmic tRNA 2-thiolation protein 1